MIKKITIIVSAVSIIISFGLFVYPTMYRYDKLEQKFPVKINRFTGKTYVLYNTGWEEAKQTPVVDTVTKDEEDEEDYDEYIIKDDKEIMKDISETEESIKDLQYDNENPDPKYSVYMQRQLKSANEWLINSHKDNIEEQKKKLGTKQFLSKFIKKALKQSNIKPKSME